MSFTLVTDAERIIGEGHRKYIDTKNRAGKEIHAKMLLAHDSDGVHKALKTLCYGDIYTFTGDGTEDRTISLQDSYLIPKVALIQEYPGLKDEELLTNVGFETDMTGWTINITGTGSATGGVAGGQSGNCCQISVTSPATVSVSQTITGRKPFSPVYFSIFAKCTDAPLVSAGQAYTLSLTGAAEGDIYASHIEPLTASWANTAVYAYADASGEAVCEFEIVVTESGSWSGIYFDTAVGRESYELNAFAIRTDTMPDNFFRQTTSYHNPPYNLIGALDTEGEITVSTDPNGGGINTDGVKNYYMVLGWHTPGTYTGTPGGSDPNWVEDGQQMLGGDATTPANRVEKYIDDAFLVEHNNTTGLHTVNPFSGYMQIETGYYIGNGNAQQHYLENPELEIKEIIIIDEIFGIRSATAEMTQGDTKDEATAAFNSNGLLTYIGTGSFISYGFLGRRYDWIALGY